MFEVDGHIVVHTHSGLCAWRGQGHMAPSSTDWGSSGNVLIDFFWVRHPKVSQKYRMLRRPERKLLNSIRISALIWPQKLLEDAGLLHKST